MHATYVLQLSELSPGLTSKLFLFFGIMGVGQYEEGHQRWCSEGLEASPCGSWPPGWNLNVYGPAVIRAITQATASSAGGPAGDLQCLGDHVILRIKLGLET